MFARLGRGVHHNAADGHMNFARQLDPSLACCYVRVCVVNHDGLVGREVRGRCLQALVTSLEKVLVDALIAERLEIPAIEG